MPPKELQTIRDTLREGRLVNPVTVREFLSWFDAKRRGPTIVIWIRDELNSLDLVTMPDFEEPWLDSPITFVLRTIVAATGKAAGSSSATGTSAVEPEGAEHAAGWERREAGYRLSRLQAANKSVTTVGPEEPIEAAVTKMMLNDYSQLPVMTGPRDVKGVVTWSSIGARAVLHGATGKIADFMEQPTILEGDASIFEAIPTIVQRDFVLVRDRERKISGIVTAADLSLQFRTLSEPFLLLSEIETHIRNLIGGRYPVKALAGARDPSNLRKVESVADLSFGEYVNLLQNPASWKLLDSRLDRKTFCDQLDRIRSIRNQVMHFDPDGLAEGDLETLQEFSSFLKRLEGLGYRASEATAGTSPKPQK